MVTRQQTVIRNFTGLHFRSAMITRIFRGKLVVVGNLAVGKTAMTQMFITDGREYPKNYNMTFGAEVFSKIIPIPVTKDGVELLIYDSPGFDLYTDLLDKFWNVADLLVVVYEVASRKSMEAVSDWVAAAKRCRWRGSGPLASVLFANKTDLENRRVCTDQEGIQLADNLGLKYFSGSVKNNQGLEDAFRFLTDAFYHHCIKENVKEEFENM